MRKLVFTRGLPGCGKSSLIKELNLSELRFARLSKAVRITEPDASRSQHSSRELIQARALASWLFFRITVSHLKMLH